MRTTTYGVIGAKGVGKSTFIFTLLDLPQNERVPQGFYRKVLGKDLVLQVIELSQPSSEMCELVSHEVYIRFFDVLVVIVDVTSLESYEFASTYLKNVVFPVRKKFPGQRLKIIMAFHQIDRYSDRLVGANYPLKDLKDAGNISQVVETYADTKSGRHNLHGLQQFMLHCNGEDRNKVECDKDRSYCCTWLLRLAPRMKVL